MARLISGLGLARCALRGTARVALMAIVALSVLLVLAPHQTLADSTRDVWQAGARVDINADNRHDVVAAGASVRVRGRVAKDIFAAGAIVDIDATTGADVFAAGSRLTVAGQVGGDVWAAGAEVSVAARIMGNVQLAGAAIVIESPSVLRGALSAAGALVDYRGSSAGAIELAGDEVIFSGQSEGPVIIRARSVRITETARLSSGVEIYSQNRPDIAPAAQISGRLITLGLEDMDMPGAGGAALLAFILMPVIFAVSALLLGLIAVVLVRGSVEQTIDALMDRPGASLLRGCLALALTLAGAVLFMVLLVGLPLGFSLMLLVPALLILGFSSASFGLGEWIANRAGNPKGAGGRIALLALGALILMLLTLIPFVGGLIGLISILMGLGAVIITLAERLVPETTGKGVRQF
jgi:hypothetical protein